jgi:hypothetical protein
MAKLPPWMAPAAALAMTLLAQAPLAGRPRAETAAAERFSRGLVAFARRGGPFDAAAFSHLTGIFLHNPDKWDDQPATGRSAQWENLRSAAGATRVAFDQVPNAGASAVVELSGRPCIPIALIERAAGRKASYGGIAFSFVLDAPSPPPIKLGREYATVSLRARTGESVSLSMEANRAGRAGCIRTISFDSTPPPRSGR